MRGVLAVVAVLALFAVMLGSLSAGGVAGAVVFAVAFGAVAAITIAAGLMRYRRSMRNPWPTVNPTPDDDDW